MSDLKLQVRMLGEFSIRCGDNEVNDRGNRSRKVWLLLAYMIYCRRRTVTLEELTTLLWSGQESSSNPLNALKTTLHRVRAALDQLYPEAGHQFIVRRQGNYAWNPEIHVTLDVERFDELCRTAAATADEDQRLLISLQALTLYYGDFLSKLSSEAWVVPISAHYHQLYLQITYDALALLEARGRWPEVETICRRAVELEPYDEALCCSLMRALAKQGRPEEAAEVYTTMSELLFTQFGIMPSEETRKLYRTIIQNVNDRAISPEIILEQMSDAVVTTGGALVCDYDFFRAIYCSVARYMERSGDAVHLAVITLSGASGKELTRRSLDRAMDNMQEVIRSNLRRGDIAARCSVSQFVILLPQANFENSQMVCKRVAKAFTRQYPHSPAQIHTSVLPLNPVT